MPTVAMSRVLDLMVRDHGLSDVLDALQLICLDRADQAQDEEYGRHHVASWQSASFTLSRARNCVLRVRLPADGRTQISKMATLSV